MMKLGARDTTKPTKVQVKGLEPLSSAWKADRLAINIYLRTSQGEVFKENRPE
jgi:hypothetical protein